MKSLRFVLLIYKTILLITTLIYVKETERDQFLIKIYDYSLNYYKV